MISRAELAIQTWILEGLLLLLSNCRKLSATFKYESLYAGTLTFPQLLLNMKSMDPH